MLTYLLLSDLRSSRRYCHKKKPQSRILCGHEQQNTPLSFIIRIAHLELRKQGKNENPNLPIRRSVSRTARNLASQEMILSPPFM